MLHQGEKGKLDVFRPQLTRQNVAILPHDLDLGRAKVLLKQAEHVVKQFRRPDQLDGLLAA
ncbi:MAG: hypothetical protein FJ279_38340 [Planctomycetes bacterium]|nr:hypothetical protein [Planctomycetota bacterium]